MKERTVTLSMTEGEFLEGLGQFPWHLAYVEQTDELCLAAVKENGLALQCVKEQTEDICLEAVKQNGMALMDVEEQTEAVCLAAVRQNPLALDFVRNKTENICKVAAVCASAKKEVAL